MNVFISQRMAGLTPEVIKANRERCIKKIEKKFPDAEILLSYFPEFDEDARWSLRQKRIKYLAASITVLADADAAVFILARDMAMPAGVACELVIAREYGIPIYAYLEAEDRFIACDNGAKPANTTREARHD
jgi:nucleoside 2-deoxyribosyltransferase